MVIKSTRKIEDSILTATISIEAFGTSDITPSEEKEILRDFKIMLPYQDMLFSRLVSVDEHNEPIIVAEPEQGQEDQVSAIADRITLVMPDETYQVTEDFEIVYAVDLNDVQTKVPYYNVIPDAACLGKAMILVFETVVADYIKTQLDNNRLHRNAFETTVSYLV